MSYVFWECHLATSFAAVKESNVMLDRDRIARPSAQTISGFYTQQVHTHHD